MTTGALDGLFALTPGSAPPEVRFTGRHAKSISPFAVAKSATLSVAAAHVGAHQVGQLRGLTEPLPVIDRDHALASFSGYVTVDGTDIPKWAELSGAYETSDGRVLIHGNFPHHAQGVVDLLGVEPNRDAVASSISTWDSESLETALIERGLICAKYRTMYEWASHPHAHATVHLPLITVERIGEGDPRPLPTPTNRALDGIRVIDCSRVLAGPVAGQALAAHGADVLRVGAEHLPSVEMGVISTGFGKRNAFVDLDTVAGRAQFGGLMKGAHLFVDAYRPGALASRGFSAEEAAELSPGVVVVQLCAFDWLGPWAGRRGFDSIVQATTGIAVEGGVASGSNEPRHMPVQALDYATGFLAAHAATRLLAHQQHEGGSWLARLSLLRTRNWLTDLTVPLLSDPVDDPPSPEPWLHEVDSAFGKVAAPRSMHGYWDRPPAGLGTSEPVWL